MNHRTRILTAAIAAFALLGALVVAGCGGTSSASGGSKSISLVAYSTPKEAYADVIKAFQATPDGKGVTFKQSYGASGDQSRAVAAGLPADVVALSLTPDINKLVDADLVDKGYQSDKYKGFVTNSVVVLMVRKGNPKGIKGFDDLARPGLQVISPNPFTSGGAKWNVMGAYGSQIAEGKTEQQADRLPEGVLQEHRRAGQVGPRVGADLPRRQGRRRGQLRERGDRRAAEGRGHRLHRPAGDAADPEPDRGHQGRRATRRRSSSPSPAATRRRSCSPPRATAR